MLDDLNEESDSSEVHYLSTKDRRIVAWIVTVGFAGLLLLSIWATNEDYAKRKRNETPPYFRRHNVPMAVFAIIGIVFLRHISSGHTLVDYERRQVNRSPWGLPWLARKVAVTEQSKIFVGYFEGVHGSSNSRSVFYFVRIDDGDSKTYLTKQRDYLGAFALASKISARWDLPIVEQE